MDVDGSPIAWRAEGDGETILFLHGLGGTRSAWGPQLSGLSDTWRCVAWDMPGYGASAAVQSLTFATIADAVVGLLDVLDVERAHICGLSYGGQQALHVALAHPGRVASLILADTSAAFGTDGTSAEDWKRARLAPIDAGETPASMAAPVVCAIAAPGFAGEYFVETVAAFARITPGAFRAACECLPTHDVRSRLGEIAAPTLVIVGELDNETPLSYSEMLAAGIADSALHVVPGVGHLTPAEAPDDFNRLVRAFLKDRTTLRT